MAQELGLAHRVRIGGYPGPIADVWAAVDLHVHATVYDSSPIAIHETLARGLERIMLEILERKGKRRKSS
jgi:hypothetical protein